MALDLLGWQPSATFHPTPDWLVLSVAITERQLIRPPCTPLFELFSRGSIFNPPRHTFNSHSPKPQTTYTIIMADEVYDGAIGIDLGTFPAHSWNPRAV